MSHPWQDTTAPWLRGPTRIKAELEKRLQLSLVGESSASEKLASENDNNPEIGVIRSA